MNYKYNIGDIVSHTRKNGTKETHLILDHECISDHFSGLIYFYRTLNLHQGSIDPHLKEFIEKMELVA